MPCLGYWVPLCADCVKGRDSPSRGAAIRARIGIGGSANDRQSYQSSLTWIPDAYNGYAQRSGGSAQIYLCAFNAYTLIPRVDITPNFPCIFLHDSLLKYLDIIVNAWGTWPLFQELLRTLRDIGAKHQSRSVSNVATRWVLDHDFVGCVLIGGSFIYHLRLCLTFAFNIGSRLGLSDHVNDNDRVYGFRLTEDDKAIIESVLARSNGRQLIRSMGDCGDEYRRQENAIGKPEPS